METVIIGKTEAKDDSDRFEVLDRVIEHAGFWDDLAERLGESGKERADFLIAIKPNLMMFYSKRDMSVITEPALVEHLVDRLVDRGFTNVALVESQNVYGNWFENREVTTVARYAGYRPTNYRIVDLTEEAVEHRYSGTLNLHTVDVARRRLPDLLREEQDPLLEPLHAHDQEHLRYHAGAGQVPGVPP